MIVVDSTVWIDFFRGSATRETTMLRSLMGLGVVLVGDLVLAEVLQGFPDQRQAEAGRRTIDLLIGTFCLERGHALLHHDRDFDPMADRPGLQTV